MKALRYAVELAMAAVLALPLRLLGRLGWHPRRVTIVGWWGSETVGDIAILGQLLDDLRRIDATLSPEVVSFDATLTRASLRQLNRRDVRVRPLGAVSAWSIVATRAIVVGGGPLMESPSLAPWALRARIARVAGAGVVLYANGIGPVRTPRGRDAIVRILRQATHVALRDSASRAWAADHAPDVTVIACADPAIDYVRARRTQVPRRPGTLAIALREPPPVYLGVSDTRVATDAFLGHVAAALDTLMAESACQVQAVVMHTGRADSDDLALYHLLRTRLRQPDRLHVPSAAQALPEVIRAFEESAAALTVRFHGFIFALATDTPVLAVDYARPTGKVSAAAADLGCADCVMPWDTLDAPTLVARLRALLGEDPRPAPDVSDGGARRVQMLRDAMR